MLRYDDCSHCSWCSWSTYCRIVFPCVWICVWYAKGLITLSLPRTSLTWTLILVSMTAYMIELLFQRVAPCPPLYTFTSCKAYFNSVADTMQQKSLNIFYAFLGLGACSLVGDMILFYGFGAASERMN